MSAIEHQIRQETTAPVPGGLGILAAELSVIGGIGFALGTWKSASEGAAGWYAAAGLAVLAALIVALVVLTSLWQRRHIRHLSDLRDAEISDRIRALDPGAAARAARRGDIGDVVREGLNRHSG